MDDILITGGAGFIGGHLAEFFLVNSNNRILIIDNFNDYYSPEQKRKNIDLLKKISKNRIILYEGSILDKEFLKKIFNSHNISKVFHLAAMVGVRYSIKNPDLYLQVNIIGTLNLLEVIKNHKIKSFIFASSSSVYGNQKKIPFSETDNIECPISPYAASKNAGEKLCYAYHHLYGIHITCLRFFTVFGPRGRPDMAPYKFIDKIYNNIPIDKYGDGSSQRDYTYIDDIIQGIYQSSIKNYPFEIFNLGKGTTISLNKFINIIENITGKKAIINVRSKQAGDVDNTCADISKAHLKLGYSPNFSVEKGIEKTYNWYLQTS